MTEAQKACVILSATTLSGVQLWLQISVRMLGAVLDLVLWSIEVAVSSWWDHCSGWWWWGVSRCRRSSRCSWRSGTLEETPRVPRHLCYHIELVYVQTDEDLLMLGLEPVNTWLKYLYKYFTSYNLSTLRSLWVDVTILIVLSQWELENSGESLVHLPCWSPPLLEQQQNRSILHQCTLTSSPCYQETIWETYWTQRTRRQQDKDQLHLILRRWELVL